MSDEPHESPPTGPVGDNATVLKNATVTEYAANNNKAWEPFGTAAAGYGPAPRHPREWADKGRYASQYPTVLGGLPPIPQLPIPENDDDLVGFGAHAKLHRELTKQPAQDPQLAPAYAAYESHLQETVSAAVEARNLGLIRLDAYRPKCLDETSFLSQKHKMLIQRAFALPGFRFDTCSHQAYVDQYGARHPFMVIIPFERRRLWVSLLNTYEAVSGSQTLPQALVILKLERIFQTALDGWQYGKCSPRSRAFARLVSHRLKEVDPVFRDFNVTSDIKWVLEYFTMARVLFFAKGPVYPAYMESRFDEVKLAVTNLESLVDTFLKVWQADVDRCIDDVIKLDPAVEEAYCPETDREEYETTSQARSKRLQLVPQQVGPGKLHWLGPGPDPHDDRIVIPRRYAEVQRDSSHVEKPSCSLAPFLSSLATIILRGTGMAHGPVDRPHEGVGRTVGTDVPGLRRFETL